MPSKDVQPVNIEKELHRRVKIEAAKRGEKMRELVEAAIRLYLNERAEKA